MYKAIFYDLDNTLYNQIDDIKQRVRYCCDEYFLSEEIYNFWIDEWLDNGPLKTDIIDKVVEKFGLKIDKFDIINEFRLSKPTLSLTSSVRDLLQDFANKNVLQFIITNGRQFIQAGKVKSLNLEKYFQEIIYAEGQYAKPSSYWYLELLKKYGLNSCECISVGDWYALEGVASKNAGIKFIKINNNLIKENEGEYDSIENLCEIRRYMNE